MKGFHHELFHSLFSNKYHKVLNLIMNRDVMQIQNAILQQQITGLQQEIKVM